LDPTPTRFVGDGELEELLSDVAEGVVGGELVLDDVEAGGVGEREVEEVAVGDREDAVVPDPPLYVEVERGGSEDVGGMGDYGALELRLLRVRVGGERAASVE